MHLRMKAAAAGALVGLTAPIALMATPAVATTTGTFDVYVYGQSNSNVTGTSVTLFGGSTGGQVGTAKTVNANGYVQFTGLKDGVYSARASKSGFYTRSTTTSTISDTTPSGYGSVSLPPTDAAKSRVKGTVTKAGTSFIDGDVEVYASTVTASTFENEGYITSASMGSDGLWGTTLAPGTYKFRVYDYDTDTALWVGPSGATADTATTYTAKAGVTLTVPTTALPSSTAGAAPRLTGTVTGAGGAKLTDVTVRLFEADATESYDYIVSTRTNAAGAFSFSTAELPYAWRCYVTADDEYRTFLISTYGSKAATLTAASQAGCDEDDAWWRYDEIVLPAGSYRLLLTDSHDEYVGEYYNDVAIPAGSTIPANAGTVTVPAAGAATAATVSLTKVSTTPVTTGLAGKVVNSAGAPLISNVTVYYADNGLFAYGLSTGRDGTWAIPATDLAPGAYKIEVGDGDATQITWLGGTSLATARSYTLPIKGQTNVGTTKLYRWGSITGRITLGALAGFDRPYASAYLYDADGAVVDSVATSPGGGFTFTYLKAGTYYVAGSGSRYSLFGAPYRPFIRQFWSGRYSLATAKPVTVGLGSAVSSVNVTLGNRLLATTKASIAGTAKVGKTLTARAGVWNTKIGTSFSYQWKRGTTVVSRAAAYRLTKKDKGKSLTLIVTATDRNGTFLAGTSAATSAKVKK